MMWPPKALQASLQEARVLDRGGADDHVAQAVVDVALDGVEVADAAAELHRDVVADLPQDRLDRRVVLRLAGEGAVQVDQVQAARAGLDPLARHGGRVFAEDGGLVHVALLEANAVAVLEIDRGNEEHGACGEERAVRRRETRRLQGFQWRKLR